MEEDPLPEGDSLVQLAHGLRPVMENLALTASDFRVPQLATVDLSGWTVENVSPHGKYLTMVLTAPQGLNTRVEQLVILSDLGMEGSWTIDARPTHQTRCILGLSDHTVMGSLLARLDVVTPQQARDELAFLGPDVLAPEWEEPTTAKLLVEQVLAGMRQAADQPVATALLDQRLVAGIGNIYRCEVLLLAGIHPHRLLSELTDAQLTGLVSLSRGLMTMNVPPRSRLGTPRSTIDVRPDPHCPFGIRVATDTEQARTIADRRRQRRRTPRFWVYGRQQAGCLRCGGAIRVETLGQGSTSERTVYWCPHCQVG